MRKPKEPPRFAITVIFTIIVFCILMITMMVVGIAVYFLANAGIIVVPNLGALLLTIAVASIIVGTIISVFLGKIPMRPVYKLIYALNSLAAGNYDTRLSMNVPKVGKDLEESFNILAEELQNTEMLRSDFVNNFSHEFKTPLVSIKGFARLLQKGSLPEEKKKEYIDIISAESSRLADMATKVLDLTKLENQNILTDVSEYNVSEQLRESILLLERKWLEKELEISADFEEYQIHGNQEMLKQVWINLIDNAIKFSPSGGAIGVSVTRNADSIMVMVSNGGAPIKEEEKERIFQKFYQGDTSHTSQGNGIGLAIVRRIVELHDGEVWVDSTEEQTTFTVKLPCE
ncbi:two-component sensor histidine kinase [Blautia sp. An249]|uniref:HAMP domain-containing sensor histidine kinase n=1 Tax=Blautia sp. An249 TaxID=1965603 RepID=UPI000B37537F|nr:HAMP domain-containing sensor histidine kinase [Blautia sp. An249]OUO80709.1 two-component sensor histidine kinase [Blautia sp. An249]